MHRRWIAHDRRGIGAKITREHQGLAFAALRLVDEFGDRRTDDVAGVFETQVEAG